MLDKLVSSSGQILPTTGFWGFLLHNWAAVSVVIMLLGFAVDQWLYIVRYRPQDELRQSYYAFRRFLTHRFGVPPAKEPPPREEAVPRRNPLEDSGMTVRKREGGEVFAPVPHRARGEEGPVIRRAEAIHRPGGPVRPGPAAPGEATVIDADAPVVRRGQAVESAPPFASETTRRPAPSHTVYEPQARRNSPQPASNGAPRPAPRAVRLEEEPLQPPMHRPAPPPQNAQEDEDAPQVVRGPGDVIKRRGGEEPITIRPK